MGATENEYPRAADGDAPAAPTGPDEAVALAQRYVEAYNNRDLDAMLACQDENIVSTPSRLFRNRPHTGHAGVRAWWAAMETTGQWYTVVIREIRPLDKERIAVLGEIRDGEQLLSPWAVLIRIRNGLITESHSYLSDEELLEELDLLG